MRLILAPIILVIAFGAVAHGMELSGRCSAECGNDARNAQNVCTRTTKQLLGPPWGKQFKPVQEVEYRTSRTEVSGHYQECDVLFGEEFKDCCECWIGVVEDEMAKRVNHANGVHERRYQLISSMETEFKNKLENQWMAYDARSHQKTIFSDFPKIAQAVCVQANEVLASAGLETLLPCDACTGTAVHEIFDKGERNQEASIAFRSAKPREAFQALIGKGAANFARALFHRSTEAARLLAESHRKPTIGADSIERGYLYMVTQPEPPIDPYHITYMRGPKKPDLSASPDAINVVIAKTLFTESYMGVPAKRIRVSKPDDVDLEIAIQKFCEGAPATAFAGWK